MAKLYDLARMTTATTGTGAITLGAAVSGFLTFAGAGVADGDVVSYGIKDGANSECGTGTYTASGSTLTRSVTKSTNGNSAISLSGSAEVYITLRAEDVVPTTRQIIAGTGMSGGGDLSVDRTLTNAGVVTVKKQIFTASGTYTPSAGMIYCIIECVGGGAGGGGGAGSATSVLQGGGGRHWCVKGGYYRRRRHRRGNWE
jgi:hypothetical protein